MNDDHDDEFENDLRARFAAIAQRSPSGPSADQVLGAIQKRSASRRQFFAIAGCAAAIVAVVILFVQRNDSHPQADHRDDTARQASRTTEQEPQNEIETAQEFTTVANVPTTHLARRGGTKVAPTHFWHSPVLDQNLTDDEKVAPHQAADAPQTAPAEWDFSLHLSLASASLETDGSPMIRFTSPW